MKRSLKSKEPKEKFSQYYSIVEQLGEGSFAAVYSCCPKTEKSSTSSAVKVFDTKRSESYSVRKDFREELRLLQLVGKDAHCVQMLRSFEERRYCYIIMERCACTLQEAFLKSDFLSEHNIAHVLNCMLSAVKHVHACGIVHRDVKPGNMLLENSTSLSGNPVVKLCDFGLAAEFPLTSSKKHFGFLKPAGLTEICGTVPYMAPEILLQKSAYGFGVDVWACGVTAYLMLFGDYPYGSKHRRSSEMIREAIRSGKESPTYKARENYPQPSDAACVFVQWLLARNPQERPDATEALTSAFLRPVPLRKTERSSSFHQTLLLARNVVDELHPNAVPHEKPLDNEERSTDISSDEDRCSTDTENTSSL